MTNCPIGATLKKFGYGSHAVVVDGATAEGNLLIRDPANGLKYEMERKEFLDLLETVIYKKKRG